MIHIRRFHSNDEEQVIALWKACQLIVPQNDPNADIQKKIEFQPDLFFVAVNKNHIIGSVMAGYEGHRGWINYLAVHPSHQDQKIGRLLVEYAEMKLKELGCQKINSCHK
ncbi:GNAT family acetyltransferase [bacterium]